MDVESFAVAQLKLLAEEQNAEVEETALLLSSHSPAVLARAGVAIVNLIVANQRVGLGGKSLLELSLDPAVSSGDKKDLPQHDLRVGDIVAVAEQPKGSEKKKERAEIESRNVHGVLVRISREYITVALDKDEAETPEGKLWITKLANDITYKRMAQTMQRLQKTTEKDQSVITKTLLGITSPAPVQEADLKQDIKWQDKSLNESQQNAIRFALASKEVALIHGPPGTGKTHTLIELILQLLQRKQRVLVCGPSNISVDNIVERLAPHKIPMLRLGHPARLLPSVLSYSLEVLTRTGDTGALVNDIRDEMDAKHAKIKKTRNGKEKRAIYLEIKDLRKEYREREANCVESLVRSSQVVLATLHGAGGHYLKRQSFDVLIIDEASQALEASTWTAILGCEVSKVILAGDHLQLPPTIKSKNSKSTNPKDELSNKEPNLETTMFDRLLAKHGDSVKRMLTTQYRMHELIMRYPSDTIYGGRLMADESVKNRLLTGLPYNVQKTEETEEPLIFYDTQGGDFPEQSESVVDNAKYSLFGDSKTNQYEAQVLCIHVYKLVSLGIKAEDIAIITPYNGQVAIISSLLRDKYPGIEIGSVDGFQGREKEVIIVSLVRSNAEGSVGFLSDKRRLNVAMTRPKRQLCIIGDSATLSRGGAFLAGWMKFLENTAFLQYPDVGNLSSCE